MIKQEKNYIAKRKKKYLTMTAVWFACVLASFAAGIYFTKTRDNYLTMLGAVFVIPLAQNMTRFISLSKFRDPSPEYAEILENMKGGYSLFHSGIVVSSGSTALFEHIAVTSKSVYFITYNKEVIEKNSSWIQNRLAAKEIISKQIHFVHIASANNVKNAALKIEKDACYTSEMLDKNTKILEGMLM